MFLAHSLFKVRLGNRISNLCKQEMGVPKCKVLSDTVSILKFNKHMKVDTTEIEKYVCEWLFHPLFTSKHVIDRKKNAKLTKKYPKFGR